MTKPPLPYPAGGDGSAAPTVADVERAIMLRRLGGSLAHVIANSLNVIGMRASMLALARDAQGAARASKEISEHVAKISTLFDQLQHYAEALEPRAEPVDLEAEAKAAVYRLCDGAFPAEKLQIFCAPAASVVLPKSVVTVVLSSLIQFALRCDGPAVLELAAESVMRGASAVDVAKIRVILPPGTDIARDRRALLDPWLGGLDYAEQARILLALAIGAVRDRAGWFEVEHDGNPTLTLYWPARGSHAV